MGVKPVDHVSRPFLTERSRNSNKALQHTADKSPLHIVYLI
jgi:hypothetical protein